MLQGYGFEFHTLGFAMCRVCNLHLCVRVAFARSACYLGVVGSFWRFVVKLLFVCRFHLDSSAFFRYNILGWRATRLAAVVLWVQMLICLRWCQATLTSSGHG